MITDQAESYFDFGDGTTSPFDGDNASVQKYNYATPGPYVCRLVVDGAEIARTTVVASESAPILTSIAPTAAIGGPGAADVTVVCAGTFDGQQKVVWDGKSVATDYGTDPLTECSTVVKPSLTGIQTLTRVCVENADGSRSAAQMFQISQPPPVIESISPTTIEVGLYHDTTQYIDVTVVDKQAQDLGNASVRFGSKYLPSSYLGNGVVRGALPIGSDWVGVVVGQAPVTVETLSASSAPVNVTTIALPANIPTMSALAPISGPSAGSTAVGTLAGLDDAAWDGETVKLGLTRRLGNGRHELQPGLMAGTRTATTTYDHIMAQSSGQLVGVSLYVAPVVLHVASGKQYWSITSTVRWTWTAAETAVAGGSAPESKST